MTDHPSLPFENSEPGLGSARRRPRSGAGDPIPNTSFDRDTRAEPEPGGTQGYEVGDRISGSSGVSPFDDRLGPSHRNAPETSRQAAEANFPRSGTQKALIIRTIYRHRYLTGEGLTDEEIGGYLRLSGDSVRPRRGELVTLGLVEDSGKRRGTHLDNPAVIWRLTDEGLRAAKELAD